MPRIIKNPYQSLTVNELELIMPGVDLEKIKLPKSKLHPALHLVSILIASTMLSYIHSFDSTLSELTFATLKGIIAIVFYIIFAGLPALVIILHLVIVIGLGLFLLIKHGIPLLIRVVQHFHVFVLKKTTKIHIDNGRIRVFSNKGGGKQYKYDNFKLYKKGPQYSLYKYDEDNYIFPNELINS